MVVACCVCVCAQHAYAFETAEVCRMSETMSTGLGMGGSNVRGVMALSLGSKETAAGLRV